MWLLIKKLALKLLTDLKNDENTALFNTDEIHPLDNGISNHSTACYWFLYGRHALGRIKENTDDATQIMRCYGVNIYYCTHNNTYFYTYSRTTRKQGRSAFSQKHIIFTLYVYDRHGVFWVFMSDLGGHSINFFGITHLPHFFSKNTQLAQKFHLIHVYAGIPLATLIGLHFLGALYHKFILNDDVLARILPKMRT